MGRGLRGVVIKNKHIEILGITDNSLEVEKGYLFFAYTGYHRDGFEYIQDAINSADDGEFGCGGTVAKLVDEGHKCIFVVVTNGDQGSVKYDSKELAKIRIE